MNLLQNGEAAPEIVLRDAFDQEWKLSDRRGRMTCLFFARGEYCPTTRGEMALWNSFAHIMQKNNCDLVFIVNGGKAEHRAFAEFLRLRPPILIDEDGSAGNAYRVYGVNSEEKKREDYKNYKSPSIYLIDPDGLISCYWISSAPRGLPTPETILGILSYAQHNGWKY
jgi:peroxiredoxin